MRNGGTFRDSGEEGSILVVAMIVLMVMSLMGIGLVQASVQSARSADVKTSDSETFHVAESCMQEMKAWLADQTRPPEDDDMAEARIPADGTKNLSALMTGQETTAILSKLSGYTYSCSLTKIASKSVSGDTTGEGTDIGSSNGYGAYGDVSPRYYYQVDSTASGPQNASKRITSIVSLEY